MPRRKKERAGGGPPSKENSRKDEHSMKRRDFEKKLKEAGFEFKEHGGNHDTYKRGTETAQVPRHKEINEHLARRILRDHGIAI